MLCYRLLFRGAPISAQAHFKLVLPIHHPKSGLKINDCDRVQLNSCLQELATEYSLTYIDLFSQLSDANYQLDERYTLDGVHLNGQAYLIWKQVIEKYI
jgi:hypothetical protein